MLDGFVDEQKNLILMVHIIDYNLIKQRLMINDLTSFLIFSVHIL